MRSDWVPISLYMFLSVITKPKGADCNAFSQVSLPERHGRLSIGSTGDGERKSVNEEANM